MSLFRDFLKFFSTVIMGGQNNSTAFLEGLSSAERYVRWGDQRKDVRDYETALEQIDACRDEDASKPEYLARKYNALCNSVVGISGLLVAKHQTEVNDLKTQKEQMEREKRIAEEQIKNTTQKIEGLKKEGSLIKAKEEEKHLDEHRVKAAALTKRLDEGGVHAAITASYGGLVEECENLCQRVEASIASLEMNENIPPQMAGALRDQIWSRLEKVRNDVQELQPHPDE